MEVKELIVYLGLIFNSKGTNKDMLDDRIKNSRICMVSAFSTCCDVTLGRYMISSLLLMYQSVFLQILLYASQVWTNLTKEDLQRLKVTQLQFLKRMMKVPTSTSNTLVLLELGVLPVENEIHSRKLVFLHHILTRETDDPDDPVFRMYIEQQNYHMEKNWTNECNNLRMIYDISESDEDIKVMSKDMWKGRVKKIITQRAMTNLNDNVQTLSKGSEYPATTDLRPKKYLLQMEYKSAITLFTIRVKTFDIKVWRKFKYSDTLCRLCEEHEETYEHVWTCPALGPPLEVMDPYSEENVTMKTIIQRFMLFKERCNEKDEKADNPPPTTNGQSEMEDEQ